MPSAPTTARARHHQHLFLLHCPAKSPTFRLPNKSTSRKADKLASAPAVSRLNPPLLQHRFLPCDHPPLTIPNNHRPRSPYPAGKQTPPAPSSSPLHPPLLPYPRVDHHPAAGECHRLARPRRPTPCSTAPSLCSLSYPGVRENPASAPTPCNRPATLLPPWCSPNLVSRLNPPHPLIHHPASARRSFLLPCPAGKPPPPSSGGTLASTRNAAKPPAASSVSWPATTQRHTNHTTAALAYTPAPAEPPRPANSPTFRLPNKSTSRKADKSKSWHPPPPTSRGAPLHRSHLIPPLRHTRTLAS